MSRKLSSRERLLRAIHHQEPDLVPVSPRISAWLQEYYGCSCWLHHLKAAKEFDFDLFLPLGPYLPNYISAALADYGALKDVRVNLEVEDAGDCQIIQRYFHTPAGLLKDKIKQPKPGRRIYGVSPDSVILEYMVKDADDLGRLPYLFPDVSSCNLQDYHEIDKIVGDAGLVEVSVLGPLDHKAGDVYPRENMMIDYYERPEFLIKLLRLFQEQVMAETKAYLEAGAKIIFASWFYCSLSAGWSPKMYRELFLPLIKEHVNLVHSYGAIYHFYDDGKLMGIIDMLKEAGVDILETLTPPPVGDVDLLEVKKRIGDKVCLKGYIDLLYVIMKGTPESIEAEVKRAIEIAAEGGFILSTSDSIRDGTPLENVKAYFQAARKFGKCQADKSDRTYFGSFRT